MNSLRTPLGKAKGLGSSRMGMHHWFMQRITGAMMIIAVGWIFYFAYMVANSSLTQMILFLQKPHNTITLMIFFTVAFYHAVLGMQVIIEDYVSCLVTRYGLIILLRIFCFITVITSSTALIYFMAI